VGFFDYGVRVKHVFECVVGLFCDGVGCYIFWFDCDLDFFYWEVVECPVAEK